MAFKPGDPRASRRWRRLSAQILAGSTHCWLCHHPLDFGAPPRTRWAPSVDHIQSLEDGGDPFDPQNLRAAHYGCNSAKGARSGAYRPQHSKIRRQSRIW